MLHAGLTGGIACGKSHVLRRLAQRGLETLDLDRVAHAVTSRTGGAYPEVVAAFGSGILDGQGEIDRKALAQIVFRDAGARARLNAIVHPRVREEEARWAAGAKGSVLVTDAALLVEAGVHLRFDRLIVVHCGADEQRKRLRERDGLDNATARARMAAQMPIEEKRRFAHFEIDTSGDVESTERAADALAEELSTLASVPRVRVEVPRDRALGGLRHGSPCGPRGLDPTTLLADIVSAGGLEMERIARRLVPTATGPWYEAASGPEPALGPETLALPVVLWVLSRGGDSPFLELAAASLARLTHREGQSVANAVLWALALAETVRRGGLPPDLEGRLAEWRPLAQRWGGAPPSDRLARLLAAAARHPRDPRAAREAGGGGGEDGDLAGSLVGVAVGASPEGAPASLLAALDGLGAGGAGV